MRVQIQKMSGMVWKTVASTMTGASGRFRKQLDDKQGQYRSRIRETEGAPGQPRSNCGSAVSHAASHNH